VGTVFIFDAGGVLVILGEGKLSISSAPKARVVWWFSVGNGPASIGLRRRAGVCCEGAESIPGLPLTAIPLQ
jgi:hypothetical protein